MATSAALRSPKECERESVEVKTRAARAAVPVYITFRPVESDFQNYAHFGPKIAFQSMLTLL
ncbi:hypothetical protein MSG28_009063 [Choristoneura fumiferana]|uniref:Uncharacterized protein n=1 Tax=Choristoneura fumiferana TaxID=7141 RepID=A0ACC0KWR5_CHOFU|nr:hypothetical protein MSG28_009063 [Choristoneura fumiferana]